MLPRSEGVKVTAGDIHSKDGLMHENIDVARPRASIGEHLIKLVLFPAFI